MQLYSLDNRVHWCKTQDGVVLLDLRTGQYHGLSDDDVQALAPKVRDWRDLSQRSHDSPAGDVSNALDLLIESEMVSTESNLPPRPAAQTSHPREALQFDDILEARYLSAPHVLNLTLAYFVVRLRLRVHSFGRIVNDATERKRTRSPAKLDGLRNKADLIKLTRAYLYLRPAVFTARDKCLLDSLVLIEYLSRYNFFPEWVVGVQTQPFGAHSWVQAGELVLNDNPEKVLSFTPLLVV